MFTMLLAYAKFYGVRYGVRYVVVGLLSWISLLVLLLAGYLWLRQHGDVLLWNNSLRLSRSLWVLR